MKAWKLVTPPLILLLSVELVRADSVRWNCQDNVSGDWHTAENWEPAIVPNGPDDTATFGGCAAGRNVFFISADVELNWIDFRPGSGQSHIITTGCELRFSGVGIFNEAGVVQDFVMEEGGSVLFLGDSTARNDMFTNNGGTFIGGIGGATYFRGNSTADNSILISNDSGGGAGVIRFSDDSSGGRAQIKLFGHGWLDIYDHNAPGVSIGSVEGNGIVSLGNNRVRVGSNNLSTTFSGKVQDYPSGGSLEKIGLGTLTLAGTNSYTGGTLASTGTLQVTQDGGLGVGDVTVTSTARLRLQDAASNNYIADTAALSIVSGSTVILNFDEPPDTVHALVVDGVVQPAGLYGGAESDAPHQLPEFTGTGKILAATAIPPTPTPTPMAHATNLSTRLLVGTGNDVGIGGFIVTGSSPRHLLLRGIGPSLGAIITNALPDPSLELHGPAGFQTITNNNWRDTQEAEIIATGRAPSDDSESAILADLAPGAYTVILGGNAGTAGVGLVEVYDLSTNQGSKLTNISTRAKVGTGDEITIAGFIIGGPSGAAPIILRGLGPSLSGVVDGTLSDPRLELRNSNGALMASDDNWVDDPDQAKIIDNAGLAPSNIRESAIAATLVPGAYTALLSGVNNGTGIGLVEVYDRGAPAN
jgi:autotransporter-associated beta strand protein